MHLRVGVPTDVDFGIGKVFAASQQSEWIIRCEACGKRQELHLVVPFDDSESIDVEAKKVVCRHCRRPLDVTRGEWVARFPDRDVPGFHVSRLIVPGHGLARLIERSRNQDPNEREKFVQKVLGLPWDTPEGKLSREAILAAQRDYAFGPWDQGYRGANLVTMGIDVASERNLNVRISEHVDEVRKRALWIGEVENFERLDDLMEGFGVHLAAIDHGPETRSARAFAERFPGRVWLVRYAGQHQKAVFVPDRDTFEVSVRRTEAIDAAFGLIRSQRNLLPQNLPRTYVEQLRALKRVKQTNKLGQQIAVYVNSPEGAMTDYAHAEVYDVMATELYGFMLMEAALAEETTQPLDEMVEFDRSHLGDYESERRYNAGPGGGWAPGPGEDDEPY